MTQSRHHPRPLKKCPGQQPVTVLTLAVVWTCLAAGGCAEAITDVGCGETGCRLSCPEQDAFVDQSAAAGWSHGALPMLLEGAVQVDFLVRSTGAEIETLVGFSQAETQAFKDVSAILRFSAAGDFDVRDGDSYRSGEGRRYAARQWYQVRFTLQLEDQRYDVSVGECDGELIPLLQNARFRTQAASLSNLAIWSSGTGQIDVRDVEITLLSAPREPCDDGSCDASTRCGDGTCEASESCSSCSADCGACAGWTDPTTLLVPSDGSRSLGDRTLVFNDTRDQGSKLVYFDPLTGNNGTADVYWWDGSKLVDSEGRDRNPKNGQPYGTNPLEPNLQAIQAFATFNMSGDPRLRTQAGDTGDRRWAFAGLAGGYPDWFLFRRGAKHSMFNGTLAGGRSEAEPMVVAAYGPLADGRAVFDTGGGPLDGHNWGARQSWLHLAIFSIEFRGSSFGWSGANEADTFSPTGGPTTALLEDCYWPGKRGSQILYSPKKTTVRRSIVTYSFNGSSHNQGYFNVGYRNRATLSEMIFYKNGYKTNPRTHADPTRDKFSRNIYQGGGAQMGNTISNIISADGASGGPQMRYGGLLENSLVVEGYWFSATSSNGKGNPWLRDSDQTGRSAVVRNNVQLVYAYPNSADPDTYRESEDVSQPGNGYRLGGASFGAIVEGNIVSGAMLRDELGAGALSGFHFDPSVKDFGGPRLYSQRNNVFRNNIAYRVRNPLVVSGDGTGVRDVVIENNVFAGQSVETRRARELRSSDQLSIRNNRFYTAQPLPSEPWFANSNTHHPEAAAAGQENWPDPDRTLKRYVTEVLGLTLLDWSDDPYLDGAEIRERAGEAYDPAGLKTFMAVATRMRLGGTDPIPSRGKPDMTADYPWDERFTGLAVVNWIRAGFGLAAVAPGE